MSSTPTVLAACSMSKARWLVFVLSISVSDAEPCEAAAWRLKKISNNSSCTALSCSDLASTMAKESFISARSAYPTTAKARAASMASAGDTLAPALRKARMKSGMTSTRAGSMALVCPCTRLRPAGSCPVLALYLPCLASGTRRCAGRIKSVILSCLKVDHVHIQNLQHRIRPEPH